MLDIIPIPALAALFIDEPDRVEAIGREGFSRSQLAVVGPLIFLLLVLRNSILSLRQRYSVPMAWLGRHGLDIHNCEPVPMARGRWPQPSEYGTLPRAWTRRHSPQWRLSRLRQRPSV